MYTILQTLKEKLLLAIQISYPDLFDSQHYLEVVQSSNEKFGHYQCNTPMKLAKILGLKPRDIAEKLTKNIDIQNSKNFPLISSLNIAGPGFINIILDSRFLSDYVQGMLKDPHLGINKTKKPAKIIIDFSSPNTAKEMHVGHLRSTIIGDCLARLFEFQGHIVMRLNHIGDWGTSFGMLIAYMKDQAPQILNGEQTTDLTHLVAWYKASKQRFDSNLDFKKASQQEVVLLQNGNPESLKAWEIICAISRKAYQEIYDLLDIKIVERGESFYNSLLPETVQDLNSKGLIVESDGAKCIFIEGFQNREGAPLPLMLQKTDGGYNYDTTDMAAIRQRIQTEKADRIIYVTDAGQSQHFQMIFKAAEMAGYLDRKKIRVDHVPFGLVLGSDGKKFRTRAGDTEKLIDLITQAIEQAEKILLERSTDFSTEERKILAKTLGIGAIKYADLSCHRTSDYVFSYDRMLRFEGNTAAFLLYAYVRIAGIKRKVNANLDAVILQNRVHLEHPTEVSLGLHLAQFSEALEQVADDLLPNRLTDYLYTLAEKFNAFFRDCRVEGSPHESTRLLLCEVVANVMYQGLTILGLKTVEKM